MSGPPTTSPPAAPAAANPPAEAALLPPEPYVPPPADSTLRVQPTILNPYERQREYPLPWLGRFLLFLFDLVAVPLRLIFIILLLVCLSCVCRLLLIGARASERAGEPGFGPARTWLIRHAVFVLGVPICWCFGFVTSHVKHEKANTRSGILIANHMGYCEIMLLVTYYAPSVVAKKEIASYPLVGTIARALQCIFIDRKEPSDRQRVMEMMLERGRNQDNGKFPPLLIFPEGTTNNGASLLKFQKGIFTAGLPVQTVLIKSHFIYYNAGWVNGSMLEHVLKLLTRLYHPLSMRELPLYTPNAAEIADPILYADNACQTMANELLMPVSSLTMYDNPEFQGGLKHRHRQAGAVHPGNPNTTSVTTKVPLADEGKITIAVVQPGEVKGQASAEPIAPQPQSARKQGWMAAQVHPGDMVPQTPAKVDVGGGDENQHNRLLNAASSSSSPPASPLETDESAIAARVELQEMQSHQLVAASA